MTKRFHISLAVADLTTSVKDYSKRLGADPVVVVPNRYALWRTDLLNFSISQKPGEIPGTLRHVGFEDSSLTDFTENQDCNGITWEYFTAQAQDEEIKEKFGV